MLEKVLDFQKIDVSNRYIGRYRCTLPIYRIEKKHRCVFEVDTPIVTVSPVVASVSIRD